MSGFSVRIKDFPENPHEKKIPLFRLLLPIGLLLLAMGIKGGVDYFRLHGPPATTLHEFKIANVTNVTEEPEIPGSTKIDCIWLTAPDGVRIRYRARFPYSDEIRRRDTNFNLLLDATNTIWGVIKNGNPDIRSRNYFENYNIEAKEVGKVCGLFLGIMGLFMLLSSGLCESRYRSGRLPPQNQMLVSSRKVVLVASLIGYLFLFGLIIGPWLGKHLPAALIPLLWVISAGILGNLLVSYLGKKS